MSFFLFFMILFSFNFVCNLVLIFISIKNKSPRLYIRFFFLSILLSAWLAVLLQQLSGVDYLSSRQVSGNFLLSFWILVSFYLNKPLKLNLLTDFLNKFKDEVIKKRPKKIIWMILYISLLQLICFSPLISLNFLSGPLTLYWLDFLALALCFYGLFIYLKSRNKTESYEVRSDKLHLQYFMHPNYLGNLTFFLGLFLLSVGATGGIWSIIGPIAMLLLMTKVIIPEHQKRVSSRVSPSENLK